MNDKITHRDTDMGIYFFVGIAAKKLGKKVFLHCSDQQQQHNFTLTKCGCFDK